MRSDFHIGRYRSAAAASFGQSFRESYRLAMTLNGRRSQNRENPTGGDETASGVGLAEVGRGDERADLTRCTMPGDGTEEASGRFEQ